MMGQENILFFNTGSATVKELLSLSFIARELTIASS